MYVHVCKYTKYRRVGWYSIHVLNVFSYCAVGVPSTTWSLKAVAAQAPPLLATSVASPAHPTPPLSSPSTSQEPQPQRQVDKGQPPQQQRQKKVQESSRREVVEQPKVAKQETPPPVDSAPSQWPSFKDVWDSSSRYIGMGCWGAGTHVHTYMYTCYFRHVSRLW